MKTQRVIITVCAALVLVIIAIIFFSPSWQPGSDKTLRCDPPPVSVYGLLNDDGNSSHNFQIRVNTSSNQTIGVEAYILAPGEYRESKILTTTKNVSRYYLVFTIDRNFTFQREVNASTYVVQSFDYNPEKNGITSGVLFHSDYSCKMNSI